MSRNYRFLAVYLVTLIISLELILHTVRNKQKLLKSSRLDDSVEYKDEDYYENFEEFDRKMIPANISKSSERLVVYECLFGNACGTWSERLKSIMSAYALAQLTYREFIINMTQPCKFDQVFEPNEVKWNSHWNKSIENLLQYEMFGYDTTMHKNNKEIFKNVNIVEYQPGVNVLIVRNGYDFMNLFSVNTYLKPRIQELGYNQVNFTVENMFPVWYNKLFKLNANLERRYQVLLSQAKPNNASKLICAQVKLNQDSPDDVKNLMLISQANSKRYWTYIRNDMLKNLDKKNVKLFIFSYNNHVIDQAIKEFGEDMLIFIKNFSIDLDESFDLLTESCEKVENVFLAFHFLQNCDQSVSIKLSSSDAGNHTVYKITYKLRNLFDIMNTD